MKIIILSRLEPAKSLLFELVKVVRDRFLSYGYIFPQSRSIIS